MIKITIKIEDGEKVIEKERHVCDGTEQDVRSELEKLSLSAWAALTGLRGILLQHIPPKQRIKTITTIRNHTTLGLKETKELCETVPKVFLVDKMSNLCECVKALRELGCTVAACDEAAYEVYAIMES